MGAQTDRCDMTASCETQHKLNPCPFEFVMTTMVATARKLNVDKYVVGIPMRICIMFPTTVASIWVLASERQGGVGHRGASPKDSSGPTGDRRHHSLRNIKNLLDVLMPARKLAVHVKDFVTDLGMQYKPDHTDYIKILTDTPKGDLCFGFCCFGNAFMMMLLMLFALFTGGHCDRWTLHSFVACGDEVQNIWICFFYANMWHLLHFEPDIACDVCACNLCVQMSDLGSVKSGFNGNVLQTEAWRLSQHPAHLHRVLHVGRLEGHGQQNP